uniref:DEP domain-containing protein n=1 Tax=Sphaeramia orbicularis TaxID=375764 RepID=A0A673A4D4_9TELE
LCCFANTRSVSCLGLIRMPLRRHWAHFRYYDCSFTGSEAVDYLHELLRKNYNFGPEVTRYQTLQLLRKFLKAHVIEDIKGRHGTEDFEDSGHLYRYFKPNFCLIWFPLFAQTSDLCNKRHSVAIGDVHECKLILRKEVTPKQVDHIWKSMTVAQYLQDALGLKTLEGVLNPNSSMVNISFICDMPYWVISAMKCLANLTRVPGFERDVLKTVADYFQRLKQPLLTFHLCLLLNKPDLDVCDEVLIGAVFLLCPDDPDFSHCVLSSVDDMDLDELLQVEEHMSHLRRVQFEKSYPEVYQHRFPTEESKAAVIPEKTPRIKPHLMFFNLKKPFQPFQRSWSFRA